MSDNTIPAPSVENDLVLVTGGSGYVGAHVVVRLLEAGYWVRATVRTAARERELRSLLDEAGVAPGRLVGYARADLSSDIGWAEAVEGVRYVMHVASPFPGADADDEDEVIRPARDGALRVLSAARDAGVERVVLTSSYAAVGYSHGAEQEYTESDWTDPSDENTAYIKSKAIAERAAWDFMDREGGSLELAVINPVGIFGPILSDNLSVSTGFVKAMLDGVLPAVPRQYFGVVDVRDVAEIHLRAMTHPDAAGERFLAVGGASISFLDMAQILSKHLGEAAGGVPTVELTDEQVREAAKTDPGLRESVSQLGQVPVISNLKARSVLGWEPRDVEATIVETGTSLISRGLVAT